MHDVILKALSSLHSLSREEELSDFLRGLKPAAKYLWQAYQSGSVCVSYKELSVQAAYMLRYFPHYAEVTRVILDELFREENLPFREQLLHVSLFGCGPAPELCGIMQFLKSRFPRSEMVIAHLFDVASDDWKYSRRITLEYLAQTLWDKQLFESHAIPLDLSRHGSAAVLSTMNGGSNIIGESSRVTLQNCLNELPRSIHAVVTENILDLLRMMKPGKVMLVIDRSSYQEVVDLLSSICSLAKEQALAQVLIFDQDRELDCKPILDKMPPILTESLFVRKTQWSDVAPNEDGLICARRVRHHCLALQRI